MIYFKELTARDISFLKDDTTLYISDFRSLGESFDYEIPSMWKYENLLPWIVQAGLCTVNEYASFIKYELSENTKNITCKAADMSPKVSVMTRLAKEDLLKNLKRIWVAVPHPEIDVWAQANNMDLNYKYEDFIILNNKFVLKEIFKDNTPAWQEISDWEDLLSKWGSKKYVIKRAQGSGGYTVFFPESDVPPTKLKSLYEEGQSIWYAEEIVNGQPMSVQCLKQGDDIFVFGFAEQKILNKSEFNGARLIKLSDLQNNTYLLNKVENSINKLKKHIHDYEGFFGIDFLYDETNSTYNVLEANIRLTAMTIPTLIANAKGFVDAEFYEDYEENSDTQTKYFLTYDKPWNTWDMLSLIKNN